MSRWLTQGRTYLVRLWEAAEGLNDTMLCNNQGSICEISPAGVRKSEVVGKPEHLGEFSSPSGLNHGVKLTPRNKKAWLKRQKSSSSVEA